MRCFRGYSTIPVFVLACIASACDDSPSQIIAPPPPPPPAAPVQSAQVGTLEFTVTTSGVEIDADGYILAARRATSESSPAVLVPSNGTEKLSGLIPDTYTIALSGVAANCEILAPATRTATVLPAAITHVAIHLSCSEPLQLTFALGGGWDDYSPPRQLWTVDSNGKNAAQLTTDNNWHERAAWSPDGRTLAFGSDRDGRFGIWLRNSDGSATAINTGLNRDYAPSWSPDGRRVVFSGGNPLELYTITTEGSDLRRITTGTPGDYGPDWSPDGKKVVFASLRDNAWGIWTANIDGSALTRLTSSAWNEQDPTWSPDGTMIAFSRIPSSGFEIHIMKADGSARTKLTNVFPTGAPAWSPDGRLIAFTGSSCFETGCRKDQGIQMIGLDGTRYTPIINEEIVGDVTFRPKP